MVANAGEVFWYADQPDQGKFPDGQMVILHTQWIYSDGRLATEYALCGVPISGAHRHLQKMLRDAWIAVQIV